MKLLARLDVLADKKPEVKSKEMDAAVLLSEIRKELEKRFGDERLVFELVKKVQTDSSVTAAGKILDSSGRVVTEDAVIVLVQDKEGRISVEGLDRFEVPREDLETLMMQLASSANPVISLHYGFVQRSLKEEDGQTGPEFHTYAFKAEREGSHYLYFEKTIASPGEVELEEKWVIPVVVGKEHGTEADGTIAVKNGEVFTIQDLGRGVLPGQEAVSYRWLSTAELLEWREEETQRVRRSIEEVFSEAKVPAEFERPMLDKGKALMEEVFGKAVKLLLAFRSEMTGLGFVTEGAAAPEAMQELEMWAADRMSGLYQELMRIPVRLERDEGRILVPMGGLIDLLDLEVKQYYKSRQNLSKKSDLFPILTPEMISGWNAEEGEFEFNVFIKPSRENESGPSTGDLRALVFSLLDARGDFIITDGAVSPTLFSLALHGVDQRVRNLVHELYLEEAEKNRRKIGSASLALRGIRITKATRNWPVSALEGEFPYSVDGGNIHTALVRAERTEAGYKVNVLSIGTPFTDEFLLKTRAMLERYLPSRLAAGGLSALYHDHGGFRGASFAVNGRPFIAELVRGDDGSVTDIVIFGDYTGDGSIGPDDHTKSRELLNGMEKGPAWFLSETREHEGGVHGYFFKDKQPVLHEWKRAESGVLSSSFFLNTDVTGDGILFFDDLAFAVAAMKDAESLSAVIVKKTEPDYDRNGELDVRDASYVYEVYSRLGPVFSMLSTDQQEVLDINKDGKTNVDDGRVLKEDTLNELARGRIQQDIARFNTEALAELESILALPSFPDQNLDGVLDPADAAVAGKNLVILKVHADRLNHLHGHTAVLIKKFPDKARQLKETLAMLEEYIETASITQDKLRNSLEEIRLGPPEFSSQELQNAPSSLGGSMTRELSLSKTASR